MYNQKTKLTKRTGALLWLLGNGWALLGLLGSGTLADDL